MTTSALSPNANDIASATLARPPHRGPALEEAVTRLSPALQGPVQHHLAGGGKRVRAHFPWSRPQSRRRRRGGVPGAVAIELIHNFSLIHDDIIDETVSAGIDRPYGVNSASGQPSSPVTPWPRWLSRCCWTSRRRNGSRPPLPGRRHQLMIAGQAMTWHSSPGHRSPWRNVSPWRAGKHPPSSRAPSRWERSSRRSGRNGRCARRFRFTPRNSISSGG